jgi:hypothetical protein
LNVRSTLQACKWWERIREIPEWIDAEIKTCGITPDTEIAELKTLKSTASGGTKVLGTNALSKHLKEVREQAARTAKAAGVVNAPIVNILATFLN